MSDLLSAWVLSSSSTASAQDPSPGLSQALDQARLSYHAQEVRRMAATGEAETERREISTAASNTSSRTSSMRKTSRRPPPGTMSSKMSVRTSVTADSGMVSGSNSTVTDTDRRYLDIEGLEDSGKSTPSERSRDDLESGSPNQIDKLGILEFSNNADFSDQYFDQNFVKEKSKPSKLLKVFPKEKNGPEKKSQKPPEPLSPNKLPRYPNVVKNKKSEVRRYSDENSTRKIEAEESTEKTKSHTRRSENSFRRSKTESHNDGEDEDTIVSKRSNQNQRSFSNSKLTKSKKKLSKSNKETDDDDQSEIEQNERKGKVKSNGIKRDDSPTKLKSLVKVSTVKKCKKNLDIQSSDESDEEIKPRKSKLRDGESPTKRRSRSTSPLKETSKVKINKSERKGRNEISDDEEESGEKVKSKKNGRYKDSPTKTRTSQSQSPAKNGRSKRESSPIKKIKKEVSKSEFKLNEDNDDETVFVSPKKYRKGKLSRSKSESASLLETKRNKSPVKKKRVSKIEPVYSSEEEEEEDVTISERSEDKTANGKPKPKRTKDVVFSDEEEDSPFGISGKGGKNYWRRNTYLDILKIEKERRETIKKMKDEKEKEKEKNGGKGEKKEKFIRDSFGNKVFLSAKGKKDAESDAPDNIDITVDDIVSKTLVISSQSNYGRNRDSLSSMIKRKLKEDHYLRSLCQTDEWFLKSIVAVMVSFGPLIKVVTKTQALTWIFLSRLTQFWTKDGKQPPGEKELLNDPETIAFATELIKLCYKLIVSDQVKVLLLLIIVAISFP